jgi:hypothetical protein
MIQFYLSEMWATVEQLLLLTDRTKVHGAGTRCTIESVSNGKESVEPGMDSVGFVLCVKAG